MIEGPEAYRRFESAVRALVSVSREALQREFEECRREDLTNPRQAYRVSCECPPSAGTSPGTALPGGAEQYLPETFREALAYFAEEENCRRLIAGLRWPAGRVRCPHCGSDRVVWCPGAKMYACRGRHPRRRFSAASGTALEKSRLPLHRWFAAVWVVANSEAPVSSYELQRIVGTSQKTSLAIVHSVRLAVRTAARACVIERDAAGTDPEEDGQEERI